MPASPDDPGPRGRLALLVAAAVDSVGGVRLSGGAGVEVATQYPGGKVVGVALGSSEITVCLIVGDVHVEELANAVHDAVRRALDAAGDDRTVHVLVTDIDLGGEVG